MGFLRISGQDTLGASTTSSVTATYGSATTAGNLLIATAHGNTANTLDISGWTATTVGINSNTAKLGLFYKLSDGTETTVTATQTSATVMKLHIYEYSGNANPLLLDISPTTNGNGTTGVTSFNLTSITTNNASDLLFGTIGLNGSCTAPSYSGLNTRLIDAATIRLFDGDLIPGVLESSFVGSASWTSALKPSGIAVAFKAPPTNGFLAFM